MLLTALSTGREIDEVEETSPVRSEERLAIMEEMETGTGEEVERKLMQRMVYVKLSLRRLLEGQSSRLVRPLLVSIASQS